ncbi:hypothetical protein EDD85DRAFT_955953 [Armillaria nabsnona]|nr:hypothetical protein EDD85DRAFT_955953 [Armillaria nabsnona]
MSLMVHECLENCWKMLMNPYHPSALFSIHMTTRSMLLIGDFGRKCWNMLTQELTLMSTILLFPSKVHPGWISGCAPASPAWKEPIDFTFNVPWPPPPPYVPKTFVFDHRKAMDPCLHPHLLREHGQFLPWGKGPDPPFLRLLPNFTASRAHHRAHDQLTGRAL